MSGGDARKADSRLLFNRLAPTYDAAGCFAHFGRRLVEVTDPRPGQRVLDVATGRGAVLFPSAERVEPTGEVIGIDLAEEMVRAANAEAERRGVAARAQVMDAERLRFPDAVFDQVLCGFGLMFLPDQLGALTEFRRVLRPGGRVGLSTWQVSDSEDLIAVLGHMGLPVVPPGWVAEPDILADLLTRAGFSNVRIAAETYHVDYADLDSYWQTARSTGARRGIDTLDHHQLVAARTALAERLRPYQLAGGYRVPTIALLAVADR